jgi:hypothetical protein
MIQKEVIWNVALLIFGALLVFAFTFRFDYDTPVIPGWHNPNTLFTPFGPVNKWAAGLVVGICLMVFRYLALAILTIKHADFRLIALLVSYSIPIFLILIANHYSMDSTAKQDTRITDEPIPVKSIDMKVKELRQLGLFKNYKGKKDDFISDVVMGRLVRRQDGYFNARQLWTEDHTSLRTFQFLRLDTDKTWQNNDTEWVVEGNKAYEDFIKEIGEISEHTFKPGNIKETWIDGKTIEITFETEGQKHKILPSVNDDWADTETILKYINRLIKPKNFQFYYAKGEDLLIIGLTDQEKTLLSENLKIEFDNPIDTK